MLIWIRFLLVFSLETLEKEISCRNEDFRSCDLGKDRIRLA